jgi:hypothetical protein
MLLVQLFKAHIRSGLDYQAELAKVLGKKKFLPAQTVEALAEGMAEAYGEKYGETIFYQESSSGAWVFYTDESCTREFRHDTCTRQWQRKVEPHHNITKRKATVSKQVDEVAKEIERLRAKYSASQRKRIANSIIG